MSVIDEYLMKVEPAQREALERIRKIAMEEVPDAVDTIGYGMPVLRYKNRYMLGFCQFKNHMSIFPATEPIAAMKEKLTGFKTAKGTIQFTLDKQIPEDLLREIVLLCKQRIEER